MRRLVILGVMASVLGCGKHHEEQMNDVTISEIAKDIHIPARLWDEVEKGGSVEQGAGTENSRGVQFMTVRVTLTDKNPGVLKKSPIRIELPRGGGAIDFANYLTGTRGSFFVSFDWPEADAAEAVQSWFVSQARIRRVGDDTWGAGCNKYFRISAPLHEQIKTGGIKANTTRNFHLSLLGGHFIFSTQKHRQPLVTQVTFHDSRFPEYFCKEL